MALECFLHYFAGWTAAWSICFQPQSCSWKILWWWQWLPSPSPKPPPKPHRAGLHLTAQGILPVITGNGSRYVVQLCPKICDYNRMIYAANKRANGSQDFASCISICFPNVFFLFHFSGVGVWVLLLVWAFSCQRSCLLMAWLYQARGKRYASGKQWLNVSCTVNWF